MSLTLASALIDDANAPSGFADAKSDGSSINLESCMETVGQQLAELHARPIEVGLQGDAGCIQRLRNFAATGSVLSRRIDDVLQGLGCVAPVGLHGDLSPDRIVIAADTADFDCRYSTAGDPAIDLSHLMAHLLVIAAARDSCIIMTAVGAVHYGYHRSISDENKAGLYYRAGPLAVAFMLEIVSSASYLTDYKRAELLDFATWWLRRERFTLGQVRDSLWTAVDMGFNNDLIDWRRNAIDDLMPREP